jgi:response regulator of citrate/malate metabolism
MGTIRFGSNTFSAQKDITIIGVLLKQFTARSFAEHYRVDVSTARQYLKSLVKEGKAITVKKPLRIGFNGKEVVTKRMVTAYRLK